MAIFRGFHWFSFATCSRGDSLGDKWYCFSMGQMTFFTLHPAISVKCTEGKFGDKNDIDELSKFCAFMLMFG